MKSASTFGSHKDFGGGVLFPHQSPPDAVEILSWFAKASACIVRELLVGEIASARHRDRSQRACRGLVKNLLLLSLYGVILSKLEFEDGVEDWGFELNRLPELELVEEAEDEAPVGAAED